MEEKEEIQKIYYENIKEFFYEALKKTDTQPKKSHQFMNLHHKDCCGDCHSKK